MRLIRTTYPKAQKEYVCEFCFKTIKKREQHQYQVIINDGVMEGIRTCKRCEKILNDMFEVEYVDQDGCIGLGLFQEYVHDNKVDLSK